MPICEGRGDKYARGDLRGIDLLRIPGKFYRMIIVEGVKKKKGNG